MRVGLGFSFLFFFSAPNIERHIKFCPDIIRHSNVSELTLKLFNKSLNVTEIFFFFIMMDNDLIAWKDGTQYSNTNIVI